MRKRTIVLASVLSLVSLATIISFFAFAEPSPQIIIPKQTTYYLQGQKRNCLWVIQTLDTLDNNPNSMTRIAIGIPAANRVGVIRGVIQTSKGNQLLLAFAMPGKEANPPIILSADIPDDLPAKQLSFSWLGSEMFKMKLFHDQKACLESVAEWTK
tara:strand:- start:351 stop:818 length:468 start_codon:yes stop_codon:yes gene_type:complete